MERIAITDNPAKIVEIGRDLLNEKSKIYTDAMLKQIMRVIDSYAADASDDEKQSILLRSIYDYWVYGNNIAEEFYFHFAEKSHEEKRTYISFRERYAYINHLNKKEDAHLLNDKYEAYKLFKPYYKRELIQLAGQEDYDSFLGFVERHPVFVAKPPDLGLAIGVHKVDSSEYPDKQELFEQLLRESIDVKNSHKWGGREKPSVVLEELICQAEALARIHPQSVNSIRATTIRTGGRVHIYHPWFKIGADGNFVTSAAFGTLDAGINVGNGIVETPGFKENGLSFEYHPQTGLRIPGYRIPEWDGLVKLATTLAESLENINYVGWDLVLTPDGWCVMEGNYSGEFMWQMVYEKGMKADFEDLIGWKPDKQFWWE